MKIQLSTFIVVSCLVHASLLLWVVYPPAPQVHIGGHAASLQITLAVPPAPGPVAKQAAAREAVRPAPPLRTSTPRRSRQRRQHLSDNHQQDRQISSPADGRRPR